MSPSDEDLEAITGITSVELRRGAGAYTKEEFDKLTDSSWRFDAIQGNFQSEDDRELWLAYNEYQRGLRISFPTMILYLLVILAGMWSIAVAFKMLILSTTGAL